MKKMVLMATAGLLLMTVAVSCKKGNSTSGTAQLKVMLTDDPAMYDEVWIDVQGVEIHSDVSGWVTLPLIQPGVYDLLSLRNGLDTLLADASLPAGNVSQMRLILGSNNSVVVNGVSHPLATPSAQQSGLKFNIHQELAPGGSYRIWIDFDAGRSIVTTGNGSYSLKPVIRTYTEATNGRIKGIVLPAVSLPVVYAIQGTDTAIAIPDASGFFMFSGMTDGTYQLWMDGSATVGFDDALLNNVSVIYGQITDVGTTILPPL